MFPKKNRIDKSTISYIFTRGKSIKSSNITTRFILDNKQASSRVAFITPKTTTKSAVKRNLLKRRGFNALTKYIQELTPQFLGVFIFNKNSLKSFGAKSTNKAKFKESKQNLENEIKNLLNKIN